LPGRSGILNVIEVYLCTREDSDNAEVCSAVGETCIECLLCCC